MKAFALHSCCVSVAIAQSQPYVNEVVIDSLWAYLYLVYERPATNNSNSRGKICIEMARTRYVLGAATK